MRFVLLVSSRTSTPYVTIGLIQVLYILNLLSVHIYEFDKTISRRHHDSADALLIRLLRSLGGSLSELHNLFYGFVLHHERESCTIIFYRSLLSGEKFPGDNS